MTRVISHGLAAALAMIIVAMCVGFIFSVAIPSLSQEYANAALFRSWSDPLMWGFVLHPLILGIGLAWLWNKTKASWEATTLAQKATQLALAVWAIFSLSGIIMSYSTFPVSLAMVLTWLLSSLIQLIVASFVVVRMGR